MYWNDGVGENTNPEPGWIVTLDVLKLINAAHKIMIYYGWIVTLDVLKYEIMPKYNILFSVE